MQRGIRIKKAFLFGSYAKGQQGEWSDIDLALVSEQFSLDALRNIGLTLDAKIKYPDIEVHHFAVEDFTQENPFVEEIIKTGIPLKVVYEFKPLQA